MAFLIKSRPLAYIRSLVPKTACRLASNQATFETLSPDILIEEETVPAYDAKDFYPVNPGETLNGRYEMLTKVGWGRSSTVWLARDTTRWRWQSNRHVVIKVAISDPVKKLAANHELEMSRRLSANPSHIGYSFVRTIIDSFEATAADGYTHLCLVYEPMREPLSIFQRRWEDQKLPTNLLKLYIKFMLQGLDYLHSECHIIHTDLKKENILVTCEEPSVIDDFIQKQIESPMARKLDGHRAVYRSRSNFGRLRSFRLIPRIADFGLAQLGNVEGPLRYPIQAPIFHAPEVLLGTGWSYSADIWNLGVLIWELMENKDLFTHIRSSQGDYDSRAHIAEMIALIGPPPKELLDTEREWREVQWHYEVYDSEGTLCGTPCEYFKGPFFSPKGDFMYKHLIPENVTLSDTISSLSGKDKVLFLEFISHMLQWLPEKRKAARELQDHPWLAS